MNIGLSALLAIFLCLAIFRIPESLNMETFGEGEVLKELLKVVESAKLELKV